jgi:hypothetical protein
VRKAQGWLTRVEDDGTSVRLWCQMVEYMLIGFAKERQDGKKADPQSFYNLKGALVSALDGRRFQLVESNTRTRVKFCVESEEECKRWVMELGSKANYANPDLVDIPFTFHHLPSRVGSLYHKMRDERDWLPMHWKLAGGLLRGYTTAVLTEPAAKTIDLRGVTIRVINESPDSADMMVDNPICSDESLTLEMMGTLQFVLENPRLELYGFHFVAPSKAELGAWVEGMRRSIKIANTEDMRRE